MDAIHKFNISLLSYNDANTLSRIIMIFNRYKVEIEYLSMFTSEKSKAISLVIEANNKNVNRIMKLLDKQKDILNVSFKQI